MHTLTLWFLKTSSVELVRTRFLSTLCESVLECSRGKSYQSLGMTGSFGWSAAVRGLCLLFIQSAINRVAGSNIPWGTLVQGLRGSPSAALDAALSKQPVWVQDMFGVDSTGLSNLRRILVRNNPELKRPGPVILGLHRNWAESLQVRIFLNDREITDRIELETLVSSLQQPNTSTHVQAPSTAQAGQEHKSFNLAEDIVSETRAMLWHTDIFSQDSCKNGYRALLKSGHFRHNDTPARSLMTEADLKLCGLSQLGMTSYEDTLRAALENGPLRIATGTAAFSSIALLEHLKHKKKIPLEIDYQHSNTRALVWDIQNCKSHQAPPEAVIVSISCASILLGSSRHKGYVPLMILPGNSHKTVLPAQHRNLSKNSLEWLFITDEVTTSTFYFEGLPKAQTAPGRSTRHYVEQHDLLRFTRNAESNFRAILWYPHYRFQEVFNGNNVDPLESQAWEYTGNVLFIREDLHAQIGLSLNIAIRDAWLELRANPTQLQHRVAKLLEDERYLRHLHRTSGLFDYPQCTYEALRSSIPSGNQHGTI